MPIESPVRLQNDQCAESPNEKVETFAEPLENVFEPNSTSSYLPPIATNYQGAYFHIRLRENSYSTMLLLFDMTFSCSITKNINRSP